jgi:DNA-binding HxlR family transcriptional regulator
MCENTTPLANLLPMAGKRSYDDPCGVARTLDVVGERWALLVVRELLLGPKRFTDLCAGLPGMSQNVLSQRLRELEQAGVLRRRRLGPPAGSRVYELTERGAELEPVVVAMARWGSRIPLVTDAGLSTDALVLALRTTFDAAAAGDLMATCELRLGDDRFRARIGHGRFHVARGTSDGGDTPDVVLRTDAATLRAVVFGGRTLTDALAAHDLTLQGDARAAERFVALFPRPAGPADPAHDGASARV